MNRYSSLVFILILLAAKGTFAQSPNFNVKATAFSSRISDEFSPVFYKGGLVFCSNRPDNSLVSYHNDMGGITNIFYLPIRNDILSGSPILLSEELNSEFNDGPATFNSDGNTIYFSRNISVVRRMKIISDTTNRLGIFSSELIDGVWTKSQPFVFNNLDYTLTTPSLSPDGERLYFASDMPGGFGGMDLYYCDRQDNEWEAPVNLGLKINTPKNESYPFASDFGILFFASDGHPGLGGKDLFYTRESKGEWISPVHMDSAINSEADDFGLVTDSTMENGYFSSNRLGSDDIFSFRAAPVEFSDCASNSDNNYCFTLYDEQYLRIDTLQAKYEWDFGNEIIRSGIEVKHCFPGPGDYLVILNITDEISGDTIAEQTEYKVHLENIEQPYLNSYNFGFVDKPVSFDGLRTNLPGSIITDYYWDFGDGFKPGGPETSMIFKRKGEYQVYMGMLLKNDVLEMLPKTCATKKIRIFDSFQEMSYTVQGIEDESIEKRLSNSSGKQEMAVQTKVYFMDDLNERQKSAIRKSLNESFKKEIFFNPSGIDSVSFQFLDEIATLLKTNPELRLEAIFHTFDIRPPAKTLEISELWARELAFYFKNKEVYFNGYNCYGVGADESPLNHFEPGNRQINGFMELIFMEK